MLRLVTRKIASILSASAFLFGMLLPASAQSFRVTEVVLKADDARPIGPCPLRVVFNGYITVDGPGTVEYTFARSDGATGPIHRLDFKEAGTQTVSTDWTIGNASALPHYDGWQTIRILSPNETESSRETGKFMITCGGKRDALSPGEKKVDVKKDGATVQTSPDANTSGIASVQKKETQVEFPTQTPKILGAGPGLVETGDRGRYDGLPKLNDPGKVVRLPEPVFERLPALTFAEPARMKTTSVAVSDRAEPVRVEPATPLVDVRRRGPNLSDSAGTSNSPDLAASGNNVYAVWSDNSERNEEIFFAVSTDSGVTFWPPVNLSNTPGASRNPQVSASGNSVFVVWEEQAGGATNAFLSASYNSADSFTAAVQLNPADSQGLEPRVASINGRGYAVWRETGAGSIFRLGHRVRFRDVSTPTATMVATMSYRVKNPGIAVGGNTIHVTWEGDLGRDLDPYIAKSTDGGRTFRLNNVPDSELSRAADYGDQWNSGVVASGNLLVWYYESNREASRTVKVHASRESRESFFMVGDDYWALNHGVVYSNTRSEAFRAPMEPHIASDGEGRFVMAYVKAIPRFDGLECELLYWEPNAPQSVLTGAGILLKPKVAAANGSSAIVYSNLASSDGSHDVVAHVIANRNLRSYNLSENRGNSSNPKVVASGNNYVVVWTDTTPGNSEIFFRASPYR